MAERGGGHWRSSGFSPKSVAARERERERTVTMVMAMARVWYGFMAERGKSDLGSF